MIINKTIPRTIRTLLSDDILSINLNDPLSKIKNLVKNA